MPRSAPTLSRVLGDAVLRVLLPVAITAVVTVYVHRLVYPEHNAFARSPEASSFGAVVIDCKLAGTSPQIAEPLVTYGVPGDAAEVYVRVLPGARMRVGIDFWSLEADESKAFTIPAQDAHLKIRISIPAFYPPKDSANWAPYGSKARDDWLGFASISVNGVERLHVPVHYSIPADGIFQVGLNPIGGSIVSDRFTGTIERIARGF